MHCDKRALYVGNMTAASSKAVAAKAAADSAAEDLQGDADDTALVSQSQMPVDVAAQLQEAQQLAQQQAADFKQINEGTNARLDASGTATASAGSTLGLGTGLSSAADPTALSADASTMDPAEKLQMAQQHQSQQAATFKQNSEGTAARLDAVNAASAASTSAGATASKQRSPAQDIAHVDNTASGNDATTQHSNVAVGNELGSAGSADAAKSSQGSGLEGLGQTADAVDSTTSPDGGASSIAAELSGGATGGTGSEGLTDYAQYAASEDQTGETAVEAADSGASDDGKASEWSASDVDISSDAQAAQRSASDTAAMDANKYMSEMASTGTGATSSDYVQDVAATNAASFSRDAGVSQSQETDQQQEQPASVEDDPYTKAQTLPDSVSVTQ